MPTATAKLTDNFYPNASDDTGRRVLHQGTCALNGGTYATNGIPIGNLASNPPGFWQIVSGYNAANQSILGTSAPVPIPGTAVFQSQTGVTGGTPTQYTYVYDYIHATLRIFVGGTELANGATIQPDTIYFSAAFARV